MGYIFDHYICRSIAKDLSKTYAPHPLNVNYSCSNTASKVPDVIPLFFCLRNSLKTLQNSTLM